MKYMKSAKPQFKPNKINILSTTNVYMETLSVRIPKEEMDEINKISKEKGMKRSEVLREVLRAGIREKKLEIALDKYRNYEITAWKAARLADVPLTKFFEILKVKRIEIHYSEEEVEEEFENLDL